MHADDLAGLAVSALKTETGSLVESPACGGSTLAYREMVEATAKCCRRKSRVIRLPNSLFAAAVRAYSRFGGDGINSEMVRRQAQDMVFVEFEKIVTEMKSVLKKLSELRDKYGI